MLGSTVVLRYGPQSLLHEFIADNIGVANTLPELSGSLHRNCKIAQTTRRANAVALLPGLLRKRDVVQQYQKIHLVRQIKPARPRQEGRLCDCNSRYGNVSPIVGQMPAHEFFPRTASWVNSLRITWAPTAIDSWVASPSSQN